MCEDVEDVECTDKSPCKCAHYSITVINGTETSTYAGAGCVPGAWDCSHVEEQVKDVRVADIGAETTAWSCRVCGGDQCNAADHTTAVNAGSAARPGPAALAAVLVAVASGLGAAGFR